MIKTIILALGLFSLILIAACEQIPPETDKLSCNSDSDCVCGGIDKLDNNCFLGNKDYYNQFVDKEKQCPDFCNGIANNLEVKCIENKCKQESRASLKSGGCITDNDCVTGGCSGTICQSKNSEPIFTTCEYLPEYMCYKSSGCRCISGKCDWEKTAEFDKCVGEARKSGGEVIV